MFIKGVADGFAERSSRIIAKPSAPEEITTSLHQWALDHGNLSREQMEYLRSGKDLLMWTAPSDDAIVWLQPRVEKFLIWIHALLKKVLRIPNHQRTT